MVNSLHQLFFEINTWPTLCIAVCLKHKGVPIGGMATALPSKDHEVNLMAAKSIEADKSWEAKNGFLRAWVAHIYHMDPAAEPFKKLRESGWEPSEDMKNPDNYPVKIDNPNGTLTKETIVSFNEYNAITAI